MKKHLKNTLNFIKQYPFTVLFLFIFLSISIFQLIPFFDGKNTPPYAFLTFIPFLVFCLTLYLFVKHCGDKNRFLRGIILFLVNIQFLHINNLFCDIWWFKYCKTQTNPDKHLEIMFRGGFPTNWKEIDEYFYFNTACICYYKDNMNNQHAIITQKILKDKIFIKQFHKPFQYVYIVHDMNLTQKTDTHLLCIFYNNGHIIGAISFDRSDPANTKKIISTDINLPIGQEYNYVLSHKPAPKSAEKYMRDVRKRLKKNWKPGNDNDKGTIVTSFKINSKGDVSSIKIISSNLTKEDEDRAIDTIKKSAPFKPLPKELNENGYVDIEFTFDLK